MYVGTDGLGLNPLKALPDSVTEAVEGPNLRAQKLPNQSADSVQPEVNLVLRRQEDGTIGHALEDYLRVFGGQCLHLSVY